jgi:hypothetical protein
LTDEERLKIQQETTLENKEWGAETVKSINEVVGSTENTFNAFTLSLKSMIGQVNITSQAILESLNPLDSTVFKEMDEYATKIQASFGLAKNRNDEFKQSIADAGPELAKLGVTEEVMGNNLAEIMGGLKTAASVGKEAIVEITAAAKVTGQEISTLTTNFRDVGISIYDVGDKMKEITNYARSVGVSVNAVSSGVVDNLSKMNQYNFENGIKGLAKMAATATRLGITMDEVFQQADKVMNPEGAIEMSAALQRLGVTSSGLLDPLRAMDMAQNDPEALQKEMVNLGKEFTRFNEKTGQMEILPGAKRRMKEVAEAVGMTGSEFAKMALKSADFDMKLKQIKMPDIAGGNEETKELIASMAQMKDGVATIKVKNDETGLIDTKNVEDLTPDDIKNLQKANEESSKSIEEIALNQLDETAQIKNLLKSGEVSAKFAKATSPTLAKFYGQVASGYKSIAKGTADLIGTTEEQRKKQESLYKPAEGMIKGKITGDDDLVNKSREDITANFVKFSTSLESDIKTGMDNVQASITANLKAAYTAPIKFEGKTDNNVNVNVTMKNEGGGNLMPDNLKQKLLDDPQFISDLKKTLVKSI